MYGSELKQYELYKLIATTAHYSRAIDFMRLWAIRLKPCKENLRYGQFYVEKFTRFLPSPFNCKFETVSLALHRPNFASLGYFWQLATIHPL